MYSNEASASNLSSTSNELSTSNLSSTSNLTINSNVASNNDINNIPPPNYSAVNSGPPADDNLIGFNLTYDFSAEGFIYLDKIHVRKIFMLCTISLILSYFLFIFIIIKLLIYDW